MASASFFTHPATVSGLALTALQWGGICDFTNDRGIGVDIGRVALCRERQRGGGAELNPSFPLPPNSLSVLFSLSTAFSNVVASIHSNQPLITAKRKETILVPRVALLSLTPRPIAIKFLLGFLIAIRKPADDVRREIEAYEEGLTDREPDVGAMLIGSLPQLIMHTLGFGISRNLSVLSHAVAEQALFEHATPRVIFKYTKDLTQSLKRKRLRFIQGGLTSSGMMTSPRVLVAQEMFPTCCRVALLPYLSPLAWEMVKDITLSMMLLSPSTVEQEKRTRGEQKKRKLTSTDSTIQSSSSSSFLRVLARKAVLRLSSVATGAFIASAFTLVADEKIDWALFAGAMISDFTVGPALCRALCL